MTDVTQSQFVTDTQIIPYIRAQDVMFDADNLRPHKTAILFFDDIVMNARAQKGNMIVLNSKKALTITPNTGSGTIVAGDIVYQGSSNVSPEFSAVVSSYTSANTNLVIRSMSGNFDEASNISIESVSTGDLIATASIDYVINQNTSDIFTQSEGLYCANSNVFFKVIGNSGENVLYVDENFISCSIDIITGNNLVAMTQDYKPGDLVYQTSTGKAIGQTYRDNVDGSLPDIFEQTFVGRVEYYNNAVGADTITITPISGKLNVNVSTTNTDCRLWNNSNTAAKALIITGQKDYSLEANNILISTANSSKRVQIVSHEHSSGVVANTSAASGFVYLNSESDASKAVGNIMYFTAGTGAGQFRRVTGRTGKQVTLFTPLDTSPTSNTKYSIGNFIVDTNGTLAGILNIPEEPSFKFRTGDRVFTITDVTRLNDSDYTMKASSRFVAGGLNNTMQQINMQWNTPSVETSDPLVLITIPTTPVPLPLPETPPDTPIMPQDPVADVASPNPTQGGTTPDTTITGSLNPMINRPLGINRFRMGDPIAQTFFTPKPTSNKVSHGVFVSSVDLCFKSKPSLALGSMQLPVTVKIATVSNGFPTKRYLMQKTVKCKDVKVSESPSFSDSDTFTKFTFNDPVYLEPNKEYALIVYSDSPEYECYIAELGLDVLGADPPRRISEQPYAGSFFRSQNATTWTPYQNQDLMFRVNKAVFSSTGTATFNLNTPPDSPFPVDRMLLNTHKLTFPPTSLDFKVKGVYKSNNEYDNFTTIAPQQHFLYGALLDTTNKQLTADSLNTRYLRRGNANSVLLLTEFNTTDADLSPVFNDESISLSIGSYHVNNAGIQNTIISIVNRGAGYNATVTTGNSVYGSSNNTLNNAAQLWRETYHANSYNIGFYNLTIEGGQGSDADGFAVANTTGANTVDYVVINSSGSGYIETPNVWVTSGNASSETVQALFKVQGETGQRGGNIKAKYVTRQITLAEGFESGDLRVYMDVIRPTGTDIICYYKVLGSEDNDKFDNKSWVRMYKLEDATSRNQNTLVELQFRPSLEENKLKYTENGIEYPKGGNFKSFAIKVCMITSDSTVVPTVTNLRILATPDG